MPVVAKIGRDADHSRDEGRVVSPRHQMQPLGDFTMNAFVEGFLREGSDKAAAQSETIVWVALSRACGGLGLLVAFALLIGVHSNSF
jgi:hypothetical protein